MSPRRARLAGVIAGLTVTAGCDQATKELARSGSFSPGPRWGSRLAILHAENPGGFLSMGSHLPPAVRFLVLTLGVAIGIAAALAWMVRSPRVSGPVLLGGTLVAGGGVGNLIDRVRQAGRVTDFLVLRIGPWSTGIFNIADAAIVAGGTVLLLGQLRKAAARTRPGPELEK